MTIAALLAAVLQYGPTIVPLVAKLVGDIESGKGNDQVSAADLAELVRLSNLTSSGIYEKLGITPPPAR